MLSAISSQYCMAYSPRRKARTPKNSAAITAMPSRRSVIWLKAVKASDSGDSSWSRVRAPLRPLDGAKAASIVSAVAGFRAAAAEARAVSAA